MEVVKIVTFIERLPSKNGLQLILIFYGFRDWNKKDDKLVIQYDLGLIIGRCLALTRTNFFLKL